ncbi:tetratricopeptide repeat protein [Aureispira anguillae]|uniref:Tetratricopeptide repeat-containing protein n=1 Tax=Aureispira anguillae TaxID=2864201 RepID=A0A915YEZ4_9BACT|nr:hypothetical protein [Aureispira anguillae]BDS11812.1 hypothetical protein AsAng_0025260 [Aureispira anguillae]
MIKTIIFILASVTYSYAQPNCLAFKYYGDSLKCQACETLEKAKGHYQFTKKFQEVHDEAIAIDSTFAYAYREKSVAYLKSGDFITWKELVDKAVYYNPKDNLAYRGWCRYQFFGDYKGAIEDIEALEKLVDYDIGHSVNGDYHLTVAKALWYKAIGRSLKALDLIEGYLENSENAAGIYDYLHLGVLYFEQGKYQAAIAAFEKQEAWNNIADSHYYKALALEALDSPQEREKELEIAKALYLKGSKMFNHYTHYPDKIYLEDIEQALNGR